LKDHAGVSPDEWQESVDSDTKTMACTPICGSDFPARNMLTIISFVTPVTSLNHPLVGRWDMRSAHRLRSVTLLSLFLLFFTVLYADAQKHRAKRMLDGGGENSILYAPQYSVGGGWHTSISIINLDSQDGIVILRLFGDDGVQIGEPRTVTVAAGGKLQLDDPDWSPDSGGELIKGYLKIVSDNHRITGSVSYAGPSGLSGAASLPLVSSLSDALVFPHVACDDQHYTGLSLVNPNGEPTVVTVEVVTEDGTSAGLARETIPAGGRISRLLTELLPQVTGKSGLSGYIKITSDLGIAAFALIGGQELAVLSVLPSAP
jgi:hypothetical protein